ncbi:hypothetical protein OIU76_017600 [Salix suchowensis]|nr:hypothetical protein OIU76_017600 [Salix suchowensis]
MGNHGMPSSKPAKINTRFPLQHQCGKIMLARSQKRSFCYKRSQQQKGKKRKSDGELAKDPKKMKEGLKQNLDKEIAQLSNIVENQENQMDDLTHQLKELGYEELEELNEKFAILCPGPSWDVYMSETEEHVDIISLLKYRSQMLDRRIQLLYEMVFKLL